MVSAVSPGVWLDDVPSTNGCIVGPDYEEIALHDGPGTVQFELGPGGISGIGHVFFQESDPGYGLATADVHGGEHVVANGSWGVGEDLESNVDGGGRLEPARRGEYFASGDVLVTYSGEVGRDTGPRGDAAQLVFVGLEAANPALPTGGFKGHLLPDLQHSVHQCACYDSAEPGDGERPVDGQAGPTKVFSGLTLIETLLDRGDQFGQPLTGGSRYCHYGGALQGCAFQQVLDFDGDQVEPVVFDEVSLGDSHETSLDLEEVQNCEVLSRLGHDGLVGCNNEERHVDAADAG